MTKLLYALEDYFDALALERPGQMSGWLSQLLGRAFAMGGDIAALSASLRQL
jgi:hypothetical protein